MWLGGIIDAHECFNNRIERLVSLGHELLEVGVKTFLQYLISVLNSRGLSFNTIL